MKNRAITCTHKHKMLKSQYEKSRRMFKDRQDAGIFVSALSINKYIY